MEDKDYTEIISRYLERLPAKVDELRSAVNLREFDRIRELSHKLKGAKMFGFDSVGAISAELEMAATRRDDISNIINLLDRLTAEVEALKGG